MIHRFLVHSVDQASGDVIFSQLPPISKSAEILFCGLEVVVELAGCAEDALLCLHNFIAGCALVGTQVRLVLVQSLLCLFVVTISSPFSMHDLLISCFLSLQFPIVLSVEGFPQEFLSALRDPLATVEVDEKADTLALIYNPGPAFSESRLSLFPEWQG